MNEHFGSRMGGVGPLRYVDVDDQELDEYPELATAAREGDLPLVLVGDKVERPTGIGAYWVQQQLASLGVAPFADEQKGRS